MMKNYRRGILLVLLSLVATSCASYYGGPIGPQAGLQYVVMSVRSDAGEPLSYALSVEGSMIGVTVGPGEQRSIYFGGIEGVKCEEFEESNKSFVPTVELHGSDPEPGDSLVRLSWTPNIISRQGVFVYEQIRCHEHCSSCEFSAGILAGPQEPPIEFDVGYRSGHYLLRFYRTNMEPLTRWVQFSN